MLKKTTLPPVPSNIDPNLKRFLTALRTHVLSESPSIIPPEAVSNLAATAKAGGVIIQFTRSDAESYILMRNTSKVIDGAIRFDIGNSNRFVDDIGASGITAYYWVKGKKGRIEGAVAGPVSATTLDLDTAITPPSVPPGSRYPARAVETGHVEPGHPSGESYEKV